MGQRKQLAPGVPGVEPLQLVGSHQEAQRHLRAQLGAQLPQRLDRVGRPAPFDLLPVDHHAVRLVREGQRRHVRALPGRGDEGAFLPGHGRDHAQFGRAQQAHERGAQRHVAVVHGIEAAAQQQDASGHASQSRCGRKSVYSRLSAEPSSGCQS